MKLTIGMPSYKNYQECWFTIQALRMYQDLTDTEILIVDNYGQDDSLISLCKGKKNVRCIQWTEKQGSGVPRNRIFEHAKGEWVINIDSHVMLRPGAVQEFRQWTDRNQDCMDLLHGPLLYDDLKTTADSYKDVWQGNAWGVWNTRQVSVDEEPYEIKLMGIGLFGCRKDAWLGFNEDFIGFGGVEGYIHEKFRQAGRKVLCLPFMQWVHYFKNQHGKQESVPFRLAQEDRVHNYLLGFRELGLSLDPVYKLFGKEYVERIDRKFFGNGFRPDKYGYTWRGNGGAAIGEEDGRFIKAVLDEYKPGTVLEFGLGLSTCLFNEAGCQTTTYEMNADFVDKFYTQTKLKPAVVLWDGKSIACDSRFDLAFVDGPFGGENREHSTRLAGELADLVIVHDAWRPADAGWQKKHLENKGFELVRTGGCNGKYCNFWKRQK